jgi:predicted nucleic acid-binding protein
MRPSSAPLMSRRVLMDTSAYFALADPRDANHTTALAIHDRLIGEHWRLFTTTYVLAEAHALLLARLGRAIALRVLQEIDRSTTTVTRVSTADERRAREMLTRYDDKDFSLTDATSFAVMERLGISVAFTFDHDFTRYGLIALAPR